MSLYDSRSEQCLIDYHHSVKVYYHDCFLNYYYYTLWHEMRYCPCLRFVPQLEVLCRKEIIPRFEARPCKRAFAIVFANPVPQCGNVIPAVTGEIERVGKGQRFKAVEEDF